MGRGLRFFKWATRSEHRTSNPRQGISGLSRYHRRLVCEALEDRQLLSANVYNMPTGQTSLNFVTVGNAGNAADPSPGYGAVPYTYQIGEYDVTTAQYCQFLNAVATTSDPYG